MSTTTTTTTNSESSLPATVKQSKLVSANIRTVTFQDGPLGMTLERSTTNFTVFVASIDPGGQAHRHNLAPNDVVTSVAGVPVQGWSLEEVTEEIVCSPSPLEMKFQRTAGDTTNTIGNNLHTVSFITGSLGLKFAVDLTGNVAIRGLDPNGQAERGGMLSNNSIVISIGGVYVYGKTYDEVFDLLADSPRPMIIQFKNMYEKAAAKKAAAAAKKAAAVTDTTDMVGESEPPIIMGNFADGKLGMALEHDKDGYAVVTSIEPNGQAERNKIELCE